MTRTLPDSASPPTTVGRLLRPLRTPQAVTASAVAHAMHGLVLFVAVVGATFVAG